MYRGEWHPQWRARRVQILRKGRKRSHILRSSIRRYRDEDLGRSDTAQVAQTGYSLNRDRCEPKLQSSAITPCLPELSPLRFFAIAVLLRVEGDGPTCSTGQWLSIPAASARMTGITTCIEHETWNQASYRAFGSSIARPVSAAAVIDRAILLLPVPCLQ